MVQPCALLEEKIQWAYSWDKWNSSKREITENTCRSISIRQRSD